MKHPLAMRLALAALVVLAISSCATSSGSSYDRSVAGDESAAARAAKARKDKPTGTTTQEEYTGSASSEWETTATWGQGSGSASVNIIIQATIPTGTVIARGAPPGAVLSIDGVLRGVFSDAKFGGTIVAAAEAGYRHVRVELFGYAPWETVAEVPAGASIYLDPYLAPLPFALRAANRPAMSIDPRRPGRAGSAAVVFRADAPGTARATVRDDAGRTVRDLGVVEIDRELVTVRWDGRGADGGLLAPGTYDVSLVGEVPGQPASASVKVEIARLPPVRASSLHGGFSGSLLAPDTGVLPAGSFQSSAGAYAFADSDAGSLRARVPAWAGWRIGGFPAPSMEFVASLMYTPYIGYDLIADPSGISVAGSLKGELARLGEVSSAFLVRVAWASFVDEASAGWPPSWDGPARFPGAGAGLILEYAPGPGRIFASAELNASTFYPGWGDATVPAWDVPGFFSWVYLRAGLESLVSLGAAGQLSASASAAARTWPVGGPVGFMAPLSIAAELAWYAPSSPIVLHAYAAGEWRAFLSWYFAGGLGLSLLL